MAYHDFAYFYDELMSHAPYDKWIELTKDVINNYSLSNPNILDLGCGTGEITIGLTESAKSVTGVDYSTEMLSVAMDKAIKQKKPINWIQQDIRHLTGFEDIDLITSYCDVINYLTKAGDVETVFKHVYNSLKEAGVFIFDVHSLAYIQANLINQTFADVSENTAYIWDCYSGEDVGSMEHEITFFVKKENNIYEKIIENHFQQVFSTEFYLTALEKAGFQKSIVRANFDLNDDYLTDETDRIFIIAQK